jgi:hypothetical protein
MPYLLINQTSLAAVDDLTEAGMDYHVVNAECVNYSIDGPFIVRSNGVTMPFRDPKNRFYDFESFLEGKQFPTESASVELKNISNLERPLMLSAHFPVGYLPTRGAYPLLGMTTLTHDTRFIRYTSTPTDARYTGSLLSAGTYLTSYRDSLLVNTGFGTVGRYALPLPVPAKFVHEYTIPKGTTLQVGTVAPNWGQSGGGVEVCTTASTKIPFVNRPPDLDDY